MQSSLDALQRHFGFESFRPGQADAVAAACAGRDTLVVMPTGAGKSLCYQLPALMRADLTIVVSPLVSLMQDQVDGLARHASGKVALVSGQQDTYTNDEVVRRAVTGELSLLYVAPERFSSPTFAHAIKQAKIGLFVVDEAHCVSQWGHDFRPDYFRLADAARWLEAEALIALTATATPQVARDIVESLGLRKPVRVTTGFNRPNLSFGVVSSPSPVTKLRQIAELLRDPCARPAIVYAGTRQRTNEVSSYLERELKQKVLVYHAGLERNTRLAHQRRFMAGEVDVVVATNAFGMGVDKADVRTVVHETVPQSLEAYYQEAGRAGRDGEPARALLFASGRDKGLHVFFIERSRVDDGLVKHIGATLESRAVEGRFDVAISELSESSGADRNAEADAVRSIVGALARAGVIRPTPAPLDRIRGELLAPFDNRARAICRSLAGRAERTRWQQYRAIWAFAEGKTCRRKVILSHFGDRSDVTADVRCCDVCDSDLIPNAVINAVRPARAITDDSFFLARKDTPKITRNKSPASPRTHVATEREGTEIDNAIEKVVELAQPPVGRTRAVEILRGGRSKVVLKYSYGNLPHYGAFNRFSSAELLDRVDALITAGRIRSKGGRFPKLEVAARAATTETTSR